MPIRDKTSTDPLDWRDTVRFLWHCEVHRSHADDVWFDVRANIVRCRRCGKSWGD